MDNFNVSLNGSNSVSTSILSDQGNSEKTPIMPILTGGNGNVKPILVPDALEAIGAPCKKCGSKKRGLKQGSGPHAGALVCFDCGKHIKWVNKEYVETFG